MRFKSAAAAATLAIPEGGLKRFIRRQFLRRYGSPGPKALNANRGDCVVQVGTPNTRMIATLSRIVGPSGRVVVIEAERANQARITTMVEIEGLDNVILVDKAVGSRPGTGKFLIARLEDDHKLAIDGIECDNDFRSDDPYIESYDVAVDTIDNIAAGAGLERIDYLEVSVNGAELEVLKGATQTLPRVRRLLSKAFSRYAGSERTLQDEIAELCRAAGFNVAIGRETRSVARNRSDWSVRAGDVYAWR